jgi:hypothetical protein
VDVREVVAEMIGDLPRVDPEPPILVQLCLDLIRSGEFAEIEATDEELAREIQAALEDAPWTLHDLSERRLPGPERRLRIASSSEPLLEESVRRFLEWLRGGGPPSDGPGGSCPPPAVPV